MLINEILGIKYPIIQGAMANISDAEFASSVSNVGGLGIIASGSMNAEQVRKEIRKCKSLTDKPFGVNVMLMNPESDQIIDVICEEKVKLVTTGAGNPGKYIEKLKANNILVFPVVASVGLAKRMESLGVDGIICEGGESGGHVGEESSMALIPQVVDNVNIPVVAAGGIADNRGFVASLCLGASGVQVGTCLLVSEECKVHDNYKKAVLKAKDSDSVVTGRSVGNPVRILRNKMSLEYLKLEKTNIDKQELEKLTLGSLRKAVIDGDIINGSVMMGQIGGMCKEIKPIKDIIESIVNNSDEVLNKVENLVKHENK